VPVDQREAIDEAIAEGRLTGIAVNDLPRVAVAAADGLTFLVPAAGEVASTLTLDGGASGVALVTGIDDPKLYLTTNAPDGPKYGVVVVGGDDADQDPGLNRTDPLPGRGSWVAYDEASQQVHILGAAPEGAAADAGPNFAVYVVEPHVTPSTPTFPVAEPVDWAVDSNSLCRPTIASENIVFEASGDSVDRGQQPFAWRMRHRSRFLMAALLCLSRGCSSGVVRCAFLSILLVTDRMLFVSRGSG
jgi:hypothetical protein